MGRAGPEHPTLTPSRTTISEEARTRDSTLAARQDAHDTDLAFIQDHWPSLPEHVKAAVMALVKAHGSG